MSWIIAALLLMQTSSVVCHTGVEAIVYSVPPAVSIRVWTVAGRTVLGVRYEGGTLYRYDCKWVTDDGRGHPTG